MRRDMRLMVWLNASVNVVSMETEKIVQVCFTYSKSEWCLVRIFNFGNENSKQRNDLWYCGWSKWSNPGMSRWSRTNAIWFTIVHNYSCSRKGPAKYSPGYTANLTITYILVLGYNEYLSFEDFWTFILYLVTDIDECWNSCACPIRHGCVNTEGSYECTPPEPGNPFREISSKKSSSQIQALKVEVISGSHF